MLRSRCLWEATGIAIPKLSIAVVWVATELPLPNANPLLEKSRFPM